MPTKLIGSRELQSNNFPVCDSFDVAASERCRKDAFAGPSLVSRSTAVWGERFPDRSITVSGVPAGHADLLPINARN
jgi:hypothetical protein